MLNDAVGFEKIFIATGYTDLRRGIDGLASTIKFQFDLDPFQKAYWEKRQEFGKANIIYVKNFVIEDIVEEKPLQEFTNQTSGDKVEDTIGCDEMEQYHILAETVKQNIDYDVLLQSYIWTMCNNCNTRLWSIWRHDS